MIIYIIACVIGMIWVDKILGVTAVVAAFATFIYYKMMSQKNFNGITGDLAGYFLQLCELIMALAIVFADKIIVYL